MTIPVARVVCTRWLLRNAPRTRGGYVLPMSSPHLRSFSNHISLQKNEHENEIEKNAKAQGDPRLHPFGRSFTDDFATIRDHYATPKHPVVLAHGLMGFDELRLAGSLLPGVRYWRGITEALVQNGIEVITASVPATGSIEERAAKLGEYIAAKANGKSVNIIAHSMGGLDARYMISQLHPDNVEVLSLTTIATPHRGSAFADYCFEEIPQTFLPHFYKFFEDIGISVGAFSQLTTKYMHENFNPKTQDVEGIQYFSYGASFSPTLLSAFRIPFRIVEKREGPNDGLVSVESAKWGTYKGTLIDVSHLDLINWTNRLKWYFWQLGGYKKKFNAIALYLDIADMLAKEGL